MMKTTKWSTSPKIPDFQNGWKSPWRSFSYVGSKFKCLVRKEIFSGLILPWDNPKMDIFRTIDRKPKGDILKPLSAKPTKWSNTLKQFVGNLQTNCLSVFGHCVILALKRLKVVRVFFLFVILKIWPNDLTKSQQLFN